MGSFEVLGAVVSLMGKPPFRLLRAVIAYLRIGLSGQESDLSTLFHERYSMRIFLLSEAILRQT